jgi:hypothetical protein
MAGGNRKHGRNKSHGSPSDKRQVERTTATKARREAQAHAAHTALGAPSPVYGYRQKHWRDAKDPGKRRPLSESASTPLIEMCLGLQEIRTVRKQWAKYQRAMARADAAWIKAVNALGGTL